MKNIVLIEPKLEEYYYEQKLLSDYNYNNKENRYECGVVIESKYRGCGYSKPALILLCKQAFSSGIDSLYDSFEKNRVHALKLFQNVGFEIVEEKKWKKFNHIVSGVVVKIERNKFIKSNLTK